MATPGQQVAQAVKSGGVTRMASTTPGREDGIVQASGSRGNTVKLLFDLFRSDVTGSARKGERVPEGAAESILPEGTTRTKTQKELAPQMLSPEGQKRFDDAGRDAGVAINLPSTTEAREAAAADIAAEQAERVRTTAQGAVRGEQSALANEGDALDLVEMTQPKKMLVDTEDGIDFNFDNMESGEDINAVINSVSEIYKNPTEAAKRGVRTNTETLAAAGNLLADELGVTRMLLRKKSGQLLNAEEMTAVRVLLQKSAQRLGDLARDIQGGDNSAKTLLNFRRQMAIHAGIQMKAKGAQTEIARALQAFKIKVGAELPDVQAVIDEAGGSKLASDMAQGYLVALKEGGQAGANKFVAGAWYQKLNKVFYEVFINGLLSYTPTHLKNALATPLFMVYNTLSDAVSASIGAAGRQSGKLIGREPDPAGVYFGDILLRWYGYSKAVRDAATVASKTFKDEMPADELNKIEAGTLRAIDSETLNVSGNAGKAIDHLGRLIRIPGRGLMAADDFWRVIASRGELYEQALRTGRAAKALGKSDTDALDDAIMVLLDPNFVSKDMDAASRYFTLTDDPGTLGELASGIRNAPMGKLIMPFMKAPTNGMRRVAEGHPFFAGLKSIYYAGDAFVGGNKFAQMSARERQRFMGRAAMGTAFLYALHSYAMDGRVTGSYPRDKQLQRMLPPGWQPYSLVYIGDADDRQDAGLKPWPSDADGDPLPMYNRETGLPNGELIYMSYQGLEPVSAFLGIAASTARYQSFFYDPEDKLNIFSAGALATYDYFRDLPMLQAMGDIMRSLEYQDFGVLADSTVGNLVGIAPLPYSSAVKNITNLATGETERKVVSKKIEYYTVADVEQLFRDSQNDDVPYDTVPYSLVGTPKNIDGNAAAQFFHDTVVKGWEQQAMNLPYVREQVDNYAYRWDMLGNKKSKTPFSFDVNPVDALWNSITPFKMSYGKEIEPFHAELIRLGAPLVETRKRMNGIPLSLKAQSDLNMFAKGTDDDGSPYIVLPFVVKGRTRGMGNYDFKGYLNVLMSSREYSLADDTTRKNMIKNAESRFYEAGFQRMMAMDQYRNLQQAYAEKMNLREMGITR